MKCIKCNTDNKLKERTANSGRCKSCNHPITFDPKASGGVGFTDRFFANAIAGVSVNDTLFFTPRQFFYFFNARKQKARDPLIGVGCGALAAGVIFFLIAAKSSVPFLFIIALFGIAAGVLLLIPQVRKRLRARQPKQIGIAPDQLDRCLSAWEKNNGRLSKLLPPPSAKSKPAAVSPDVTQYSFDRLVVCEHASVAQFLIANNFHFENNCAVLSIDKYPHNIFDTVMEMLRRNPALKVYALHDASPAGVQLAHRLASEPDWFQGSAGVEIHDLGVLPRQIIGKPVFERISPAFAQSAEGALATPGGASLRPEEAAWLRAGKYVELESVSPRVLLRVVTLGIARSRVPGAGDALVPISDGYYGDSIYVFAYDSFG